MRSGDLVPGPRLLERDGLAFGADTNASTSFERTIYSLDLPRTDASLIATASGTPSSIIYRGRKAFSAPETVAFRNFVLSRRVGGIQQIRAHITFHTNGELILWPYGYTKTDIPKDMTALDHAVFVAAGRNMARRNGYTAEQSSDLYITDGDQIDWLYGRERIFSYTWELFPTETPTVWGDHYPADENIAAQTANNRSALLYFLSTGSCPYATLGRTARPACLPMRPR